MDITQGKLFQHVFFLNHSKNAKWEETKNKVAEMKVWCNENLNGQWILIEGWQDTYSTADPIAISYFSKAVHDVPVPNMSYPPAEVRIKTRWMIAFEREDDAVAFKLKWND